MPRNQYIAALEAFIERHPLENFCALFTAKVAEVTIYREERELLFLESPDGWQTRRDGEYYSLVKTIDGVSVILNWVGRVNAAPPVMPTPESFFAKPAIAASEFTTVV